MLKIYIYKKSEYIKDCENYLLINFKIYLSIYNIKKVSD